MEKKYEILENDYTYVTDNDGNDIELHRIRSLKGFGTVKAGDIGGYIEHEDNLSHEGFCWIHEDAKVFGNAQIFDNAHIYSDAVVCDNATVCDDAKVEWSAEICGYCYICDNALITDNVYLDGSVHVCGNTVIGGQTTIILEDVKICANARIRSCDEYAYVKGFGSQNRGTLFYVSDYQLYVSCGCFNGTVKEFIKKVKEKHGRTYLGREYIAIANLMKKRFKSRNLI